MVDVCIVVEKAVFKLRYGAAASQLQVRPSGG